MKQHLVNLFVTYHSADDFCTVSPLKILVNNENEIFKIPSSVTKVFECNHKTADTWIIFYALQQKTNVVLCSKDIDVLVSMVFAYALNKINKK